MAISDLERQCREAYASEAKAHKRGRTQAMDVEWIDMLRYKYLERTLAIIADYKIKPDTNVREALSMLIAVAKTALHREFGPEHVD
jgi:hypothetical protein